MLFTLQEATKSSKNLRCNSVEGGFGAFTQPAGYGFDFHSASAGYSQWGAGRSGEYYRADPYGGPPGSEQAAIDRQGRVAAAEQAMQVGI